ncbi:MAG TPA: glycosyltransferase family 39 protein, partial [Acidimicrobiales bacterium]|nr:glycosyltransferase family 39 protein [Acidimicrobiales bacterium]
MAGGDSARAGTTSIPGPLSVELVEATRPGAPAHRRAGTDDGAGVGRHPLRWPDTCAVLLLVVVGVVLPALLALGAHAFDIPRNDDWAYRRALEGFTRTGHISMAGWGAMTLVGQIFWATPFMLLLGDRSWVPGLAVAVLSGLGLVAAYALARSLLDWGRAVAACLLLLALPGFAPNTSSYMTDVPAFAAEAGCLALGLVALCRSRSSRWAWLAASLAVGAFGFSIREFDLAAPVAVLAVLIVRDRRRLSRYFLAGAPLALACGLTYWWAAHLPGSQHKALGLPSLATLRSMLGAFFTLALFVSPVLPFAWRRQRWPPRRSGVIGAAACLAGGIWLIAGHAPVLIGNYLTRSGAEGAQVLAGYRPGLFPRPFWDVLQGTALGAGTALTFVACNGIRVRRPLPRSPAGESLVKAFLWMSTAGLVAYGLFVRASLFDRYLWPLS